MFVDASAIVAIIAGEPEADHFLDSLDQRSASTSAMAIWESVVALARISGWTIEEAEVKVRQLLRRANIEIVPVGSVEAAVALTAFAQFGKGRHPARLNMGDCFAYACAKTRGVPLLYKGDDFAQTDIAAA